MKHIISKSKFKPQMLEYFRKIEKTGQEIIITDRGIPVLKVVPYTENHTEALQSLRDSVMKYDDPTKPVGLEGWETLK